MRKVIITGANGFIGSALVKKLIAHNIEVVGIDNSFENSKLPENPLITKFVSNLDNVEQLVALIPSHQYDAFYHFAWRGVNGADKANPEIQCQNIEMTLRCADMAKRLSCQKFLCAGTVAEQAIKSLSLLSTTNGGMIYGIAKHCAHLLLETLCKNIGLDFVWMQFSNIYGPENKTGNLVSYTIGELKANREAMYGPATQPYDFIFIDDLIEAIFRLGKDKTKRNSYFIGSGEPRLLKEYLQEIGYLMGHENLIKIGHRPDDGIVYSWDMFSTSDLLTDIGEYVTGSFRDKILYTINHY